MEGEELKNKLLDIVDYFYKGKYSAGSEALNQILPFAAQYIEGLAVEKKEGLLNEALVPLLGAMEKQDGILVADIIMYELLERI